MSDKQPPTLDQSLDPTAENITAITIPVLSDVIDNEELENNLLANLDLPDDIRQQLAQRITTLVQQRMDQTLPGIMQDIQLELSRTIQQHIAESLPGILNETLSGLRK